MSSPAGHPLRRHGLGRLGECPDGERKWGLGDLGHHAGVCWQIPVYCDHPRLVRIVGVRGDQRGHLFDLGYRLWVYGGGVVPEGVLGGVLVWTGGTSRGLHGLKCEGVVEGDIVEAVDFSGHPSLPFRQRGVALGAVQSMVDSRPLRVRVDGNFGARCCVYADSLCGSRLARLVVVSQGVPWVVIKWCMACVSCTWCGVRRRMTSIVVTPWKILLQSMVPVYSRHVVAVPLVWFPPRGSW